MSSADSGSIDVPSLSGSVTFGLTSDSSQTWTKNLSFDISSSGINPGATLTLTEHLTWNGTGPSPFKDWHETIISPDFQWQGGVISLGPTAGTVSNGNKDIVFDFPPQTGNTHFDITKVILYTGQHQDPGIGATVAIQILEQPSVPEPEVAALVTACGLLFWAASRHTRSKFRGAGSRPDSSGLLSKPAI